jgi:phosphoglycolate phosphatase-like HAD superfamily hydrolase
MANARVAILFDIDGTLITTGGAGGRVVAAGVR